jgi:hypothetical protein
MSLVVGTLGEHYRDWGEAQAVGKGDELPFATKDETSDVAIAPSANMVGQASSLSFFHSHGNFTARSHRTNVAFTRRETKA